MKASDKSGKKKAGCGGCLLLFLTTFLIGGGLLTAVGAYVYYVKVPQWRKEVGPYLQQQGKAFLIRQGKSLLGRWALLPISNVIDESELTKDEKKAWVEYIDQKWEVAFDSTDIELTPFEMVELSRKVIDSHAGYYYAIGFVRDEVLDISTLNSKQKRRAEDLFTSVMADIHAGKYSLDQLRPVYSKLIRLNGGWKTTSKMKRKKETFNSLRDICRYLDELVASGEFDGDGKEVDLTAELRAKLDIMKQGIDKLEATPREAVEDPEEVTAWRIVYAILTNIFSGQPVQQPGEEEAEVPEEVPEEDPGTDEDLDTDSDSGQE